jgi:hypothetical protein
MTWGPTAARYDSGKRLPSPSGRECRCPGREVPFYCPAHGRVENPNWPMLKRQVILKPSLGITWAWARVKTIMTLEQLEALKCEFAMHKAYPWIVVTILVSMLGGTLSLMNNACKGSRHSYCAPEKVRHHAIMSTTPRPQADAGFQF